ncbi:MAG: MG2 domain-containing protein, partial [Deltaproteobacteria bacterium]|nr:MG2 domain-containing protein [Deltaproteobacteria bacterium]
MRRREPRRFWSALVGLLVIAGGGYGAYRYIASRPQPAYITATVCEPAPTGLDADAKPNPLRIVFSGAAAPLERIGKVVSSDFTVSPPIAGNWEWLSDTELRFSPAAEWPVGQPYVLEIKPGFLAPQARMQRPRVEFRSPPITATVAASEFWEDPTDAQNKRVAVTLQFTHPVDKAALEKRLALRMRVDPVTSFDNQQARSLGFKVSYDDTGARAFVQSEAIRIPDRPGAVQLRLDAGVPAARGGAGTDVPVLTEVAVPGVATYFQVGEINAAVVTNQAHRMEHVATVDFTAPVKAETLAKYVSVWELPLDRPAIGDAPAEKNFSWSEPEQVVPEVLAVARKLDVTWLPTETDWSKQQSFRFEAAEGRPLFVQIEKDATAFGDYALVEPYRAVVPVEAFPRTVEIMHDGAVLALSGQRKLSVLARNLDAIEIKLSRLLPSTVAHFASQTGGSFQQPYFRSNSFGLDDLAEVVREVRPLAPVAPGEAQYEVVDFGAFLANGAPPRGLFQLQVSAWDPERKLVIDDIEAAARVVLVTDLGFLVKDALDGSHDVFVVSVASGQPVADAEVQILGRNGLPVLTRTTDAAGRASFPPTADFTREKQPVAYVVQKAGDLSFLPFDRRDRRLDFSRFDTGGLSDDAELESLQGYLFSDRGVYRPGEEVTLGLIVKKLDWTPLPDDLPLLLEVIDARDRTIQSESVRMPREGFRDFRFKTFDSSPTGTYQVRLSIARDGESHALLGETTVKVEEFLPDRMTITTTLSPSRAVGWVAPKELVARVSLRNLIGTPATGNRIKASLRLAPALPSFARWPAWHFYDPLTAKQSYDETLAELSTGDDGTAELPLHLERFDSATYRLRVIAEGFETEGNRSVASDATALVSPLPYLVGWKADGDLNWIKRDTACAVNIVAVGPDLEPIATDDVSAELFEITYVRVLAKQENGLLGYQSVRKDISQGTQPLPLGAAPLKLILPTAQAGSFVYVLRDKAGTELNRIGFEVVGDGNVAGRVERNAELKVRLDKADYAPGDEIEMSIVAPYAGAGLITIERDRVYASAWFKSDGNATVQRIRLPEAVEGNAYIVVSFVRDLASRDIFVSPLSSG